MASAVCSLRCGRLPPLALALARFCLAAVMVLVRVEVAALLGRRPPPGRWWVGESGEMGKECRGLVPAAREWAGVIHCSARSRWPLLGERRRGKTRWMSGLRVMMQAHEM